MNKPNKTELEYFIRYSLDSDKYKRYMELYEEIERLNNILKDVLKRQNEALKYIGNFLSMDDRYKNGNGNDQMKIVRNILNKHNKELKGVDKE